MREKTLSRYQSSRPFRMGAFLNRGAQVMNMRVNLGKDSYDIIIEKGILNDVLSRISPLYKGERIVIISDDNVYPLYGETIKKQLSEKYQVGEIIIPHGEPSKQFEHLPDLYSKLLSYHMTRTDLIIALGGGVVGDLAGFVAATFLRGIKFIQIPTSLLAQVDSSVGGKVAVDLPEGKNLVGAFKHPLMVLIDPLTLKTLDSHFIKDGMGEVIKYGCIKDQDFFNQIAQYDNFEALYEDIDDIIYRCVDIKRDVVEKDLFDFGDRLCLNFGHTIGHSIEQHYHYEKYSHGEAVGIGMVAITRIGEEKGFTPKGCSDRIIEVLRHYDLPIAANVHTKDLLEAISHDKKNINKSLSFVLLKDIGEYFIHKDENTFILTSEVV